MIKISVNGIQKKTRAVPCPRCGPEKTDRRYKYPPAKMRRVYNLFLSSIVKISQVSTWKEQIANAFRSFYVVSLTAVSFPPGRHRQMYSLLVKKQNCLGIFWSGSLLCGRLAPVSRQVGRCFAAGQGTKCGEAAVFC